MSHLRRSAVSPTALVVAVVLLSAFISGCGGDKAASAGHSDQASSTAGAPPGTQTNLPFALDGVAAAVAVTDRGVYVADTGRGNKFDTQGIDLTGHDGRVVTLEAGATKQKDVTTQKGVPISLAAGPDGAIYVAFANPKRVVRIAAGSTEPAPLPFEFGSQILDPSPLKIAVTPAGDVVRLITKDLQLLSKGAQAPHVINTCADKQLLAVDPKGAMYFVDKTSHDLDVIESGSSEVRTFESQDKTDPTKRVVAMACDVNGYRDELTESCGSNQEAGTIRPCTTFV